MTPTAVGAFSAVQQAILPSEGQSFPPAKLDASAGSHGSQHYGGKGRQCAKRGITVAPGITDRRSI